MVVLDAEVGQVEHGRRRDWHVFIARAGQPDLRLPVALVAVGADGLGGDAPAAGQDDVQGHPGRE